MTTAVAQNQFVQDEEGFVKEVDPQGAIISWSKTIDPGNGLRPSVFKGATKKEISQQIEESFKNQTQRIVQQERQIKLGEGFLQPDPDVPLPKFERRDLSNDERWNIAKGLTDPTKAPDAIRGAIEAEFGVPIETVRQTLRKTAEIEQQLQAKAAGEMFASQHPEYVLCKENAKTMVSYLLKKKMAPTVRNMEIAFADLKEVLILKSPEADTVPPANDQSQSSNTTQTQRVTRPRSASTALDDRSSSATSRVRTTQVLNGPSLEQIEAMTASQFEVWASNPSNSAYYEQLVAARKSGR